MRICWLRQCHSTANWQALSISARERNDVRDEEMENYFTKQYDSAGKLNWKLPALHWSSGFFRCAHISWRCAIKGSCCSPKSKIVGKNYDDSIGMAAVHFCFNISHFCAISLTTFEWIVPILQFINGMQPKTHSYLFGCRDFPKHFGRFHYMLTNFITSASNWSVNSSTQVRGESSQIVVDHFETRNYAWLKNSTNINGASWRWMQSLSLIFWFTQTPISHDKVMQLS